MKHLPYNSFDIYGILYILRIVLKRTHFYDLTNRIIADVLLQIVIYLFYYFLLIPFFDVISCQCQVILQLRHTNLLPKTFNILDQSKQIISLLRMLSQ